ncbi:hypothetical protein ACWDZ4_25755 [Streptomyces sp. NPDC003016]
MAHQYPMEGVWPVWQFTVATLDQYDLDAEELIRSLPRVCSTGHVGPSCGLTSHISFHIAADGRPALTIAACLHLPVVPRGSLSGTGRGDHRSLGIREVTVHQRPDACAQTRPYPHGVASTLAPPTRTVHFALLKDQASMSR